MSLAKLQLAIIGITVLTLSANAQQIEVKESTFRFAAPEKCWAYANWSAAQLYDSNSPNHAEQLLAEPEVQTFTNDLIKRIGLLGPALVADQSEKKRKLMYFISPKLTEIMFKRNGCFFVEDVRLNRNFEFKKFKAALMVDAGDDAAKLSSRLALLFTVDYEKLSDVTIGGIAFRKFMLNEESKTELLIGNSNGLLIVAIDEQTITGMLQRIAAKKDPDWLNGFVAREQVERVSSFSYFDVKQIRDRLTPLGGPQAMLVVDSIGLAVLDDRHVDVGDDVPAGR